MRHLGCSLACVLAVLGVADISEAQEWTRFRGPNGTGISDARGLPVQWTEADYNWKIAIPGRGHSQPVLWGEKVFVTSAAADGSTRSTLCVDAKDGSILWERTFESKDYQTNSRNNHGSSSPTVDAERVYFVYGHPGELTLVALTHAGEEKWRYGLGPFISQHGFGASPMVFEDTVIFACVQAAEGTSFIVALDCRTGKERWKTVRRGAPAAYCVPCVHQELGEQPQLLFTSAAHGISGLDARSGKPLWEATVFDKRAVSSPVVAGDLVIGSCGSGGGGNYVAAVRLGGKGDVTDTHQVYQIRQSAPYVPTPIFKDGRIYLWSDRGGIVTCVKAATGDTLWRERAGGDYFGSPVWAEGRLYCISIDGEVVVVKVAGEFEVLARNALGEPSHSTPAIAGGRMYFRTVGHLISLGGK